MREQRAPLRGAYEKMKIPAEDSATLHSLATVKSHVKVRNNALGNKDNSVKCRRTLPGVWVARSGAPQQYTFSTGEVFQRENFSKEEFFREGVFQRRNFLEEKFFKGEVSHRTRFAWIHFSWLAN